MMKSKEVIWPACLWCRNPAAPADLSLGKKDPNVTTLCPRCVSLVLCRMAIARWGPLGDRPESFKYESHPRRLADHEARIIAEMQT